MQPAYQIPLTQKQLGTLGEICAIQGQIELTLQNTVRHLLGVPHKTVLAIMGSTSVRTNSEIFIEVARCKCDKPDLLRIAEDAFILIKDLSEGRNDFVHAIFGTTSGGGFRLTSGGLPFGQHESSAMRVRNRKKRPACELQDVRDIAAKISCALAHFDACLVQKMDADSLTPWRGKF